MPATRCGRHDLLGEGVVLDLEVVNSSCGHGEAHGFFDGLLLLKPLELGSRSSDVKSEGGDSSLELAC